MEKRDLYDKEKNLTRETIYKGDKVPSGRYYITVLAWIQNDDGKFLIQKRALKKDGKWSTTGGHPVSGQTSEQGIYTEIKEELGLDLRNEKIKLFKTIKTEDDFVDLYYIKANVNINNIVLQEEEVENVKWATTSEIEKMISNGEFSESHAEFYNYCMKYLNTK